MSHFTNSLLLAAALGMSASTLAENCTGDAAKLSAMDTVVMALNTQDLSLLDGIARSDFNRVAPDVSTESLDAWKTMYAAIFDAFPDYRITNELMAADCDGGFIRWNVTATNSGNSAQSTTGNRINVTGVSNFLFDRDGKITHEMVFWDPSQMAQQLESEAIPYVAR